MEQVENNPVDTTSTETPEQSGEVVKQVEDNNVELATDSESNQPKETEEAPASEEDVKTRHKRRAEKRIRSEIARRKEQEKLRVEEQRKRVLFEKKAEHLEREYNKLHKLLSEYGAEAPQFNRNELVSDVYREQQKLSQQYEETTRNLDAEVNRQVQQVMLKYEVDAVTEKYPDLPIEAIIASAAQMTVDGEYEPTLEEVADILYKRVSARVEPEIKEKYKTAMDAPKPMVPGRTKTPGRNKSFANMSIEEKTAYLASKNPGYWKNR